MEMDLVSLLRLDKFLCDLSLGTRSEIKTAIKKGMVIHNGVVCKDPSQKFDTDNSVINYKGVDYSYVSYEYFMLNKPAGVLSAANDKSAKTVVDIIVDAKRRDLFPIGRLDKDTEGLLIISNDGALAHKLLTPKKHVPKTYYAKVNKVLNDEDVDAFANGMTVDRDIKLMPAKLEILKTDENTSEVLITICEGKFHQVKKMVENRGGMVTYLKRLSMGELKLDENLNPGEYRALSEKEIGILKGMEC